MFFFSFPTSYHNYIQDSFDRTYTRDFKRRRKSAKMFGTIPNQFLHQQSLDFSFPKFLQSQINVTASPQTETFLSTQQRLLPGTYHQSKVGGGHSSIAKAIQLDNIWIWQYWKIDFVLTREEEHSCPSSEYPKILPTAGFSGNKRINSIAGLCGQKQFYSAKVSSMLPLCRIAPLLCYAVSPHYV